MQIFDSHLHDSHDAWEQLPPKAATALMRKAGLKAAMVSSSSDEGTQMLYAEAPDLGIPVLRLYRFGTDADLPVMPRVLELVRENKLYLHSHSDADAIERQFKQDPNALIL